MNEALEQKLRETVARGYCNEPNTQKELDSDLLHSIVEEIMLALEPACHPDRRLPLMVVPPKTNEAVFIEVLEDHRLQGKWTPQTVAAELLGKLGLDPKAEIKMLKSAT